MGACLSWYRSSVNSTDLIGEDYLHLRWIGGAAAPPDPSLQGLGPPVVVHRPVSYYPPGLAFALGDYSPRVDPSPEGLGPPLGCSSFWVYTQNWPSPSELFAPWVDHRLCYSQWWTSTDQGGKPTPDSIQVTNY